MSNRTNKEPEGEEEVSEAELVRRRAPLVGRSEWIVERLIREGMEQGKFSNLANEGRPLKVKEENPYVEEDMRLAYKILENAGSAPPWIEMEKEVEAAIAQVKRERENHRRWLRIQLGNITSGPTHLFIRDMRRLAATHERWLKNHADKLKQVNEKIHTFNHVCPVDQLHKLTIQIDGVIQDFDDSCPAIPRV